MNILKTKEIKLRFSDCETQFIINKEKKIVVCILKSFLCNPYGYNNNKFIQPINGKWITSIGVAKCHQDDAFDVERGKHISLAKAENKAYKKAINFLGDYEKIYNELLDIINDFKIKGTKQNKHNEEYIEIISNPNHPKYKERVRQINSKKIIFK